MNIKIKPLPKPITAEIALPGCIGYTIRALNIAAMTKGSVKIINPLKSDDTYAMEEALKTLGIKVEERKDCFIVHGDISEVIDKQYEININISGRTARSILALLCIVPGIKTVICKDSFKKRPIGDLVDGLRQLGARIEYLEKEDYLPVKILSSKLSSGKVKMKGNLSSQYFSAIMMVAPMIGDIKIDVIGKQASKSFIDMTIAIMKDFGVTVINENYKRYLVKADQRYKNPKEYIVETESTSASYFFGIAAITKSKVKVLHLSPDSKQGDIRFVDILEKMGCKVKKNKKEKWIEVEGTNKLVGITASLSDTPDQTQTLAVVAAFAKGITKIKDIEHLRLKETNRIESPKKELQKVGIHATSTKNSLTISGGQPHGKIIETYGDHRMAMAFAVAGTKISGIEIKNSKVVDKSFPSFWKKLEEIGVEIIEKNL